MCEIVEWRERLFLILISLTWGFPIHIHRLPKPPPPPPPPPPKRLTLVTQRNKQHQKKVEQRENATKKREKTSILDAALSSFTTHWCCNVFTSSMMSSTTTTTTATTTTTSSSTCSATNTTTDKTLKHSNASSSSSSDHEQVGVSYSYSNSKIPTTHGSNSRCHRQDVYGCCYRLLRHGKPRRRRRMQMFGTTTTRHNRMDSNKDCCCFSSSSRMTTTTTVVVVVSAIITTAYYYYYYHDSQSIVYNMLLLWTTTTTSDPNSSNHFLNGHSTTRSLLRPLLMDHTAGISSSSLSQPVMDVDVVMSPESKMSQSSAASLVDSNNSKQKHDSHLKNMNKKNKNNKSFQSTKSSLSQQQQTTQDRFRLKRSLDYERYTVRINTWKRQTQLGIVINHLLTCNNVAQIQVIWCIGQGPVPIWLRQLAIYAGSTGIDNVVAVQHEQKQHEHAQQQQQQDLPLSSSSWPRLVIEEHVHDDSLNARFDVQLVPPTAGILTQDDDVLRPCIAMDAGFALWTWNPERLIGYDARRIGQRQEQQKQKQQGSSSRQEGEQQQQRHVMAVSNNVQMETTTTEDKDKDKEDVSLVQWTYGPLSQAKRWNEYSIVLTRFAFVHVQYLYDYTNLLPNMIRQRITKELNCEDIAMSLYISSMTQGQVPLLADTWTISTLIKLPTKQSISLNTRQKQQQEEHQEQVKDNDHNNKNETDAVSFNANRKLHVNEPKSSESSPQPPSHKQDHPTHATIRNACVNDFAELLHLKKTTMMTNTTTTTSTMLLQNHFTNVEWMHHHRPPSNNNNNNHKEMLLSHNHNVWLQCGIQGREPLDNNENDENDDPQIPHLVLPMGTPGIQLLKRRRQWKMISSQQIIYEINQMKRQVFTKTIAAATATIHGNNNNKDNNKKKKKTRKKQ